MQNFTKNDLYVLSSGNFILTASIINIPRILKIDSDSFYIINYVKSITKIDNISPSTNFDVLLVASFIGDDQVNFILPLTVTIE